MAGKVLTEEELLQANTYVPLMEKVKFVNAVAEKCVEKLNIQAEANNEITAMPPLYKESMERKSRYLMGALVKLYLRSSFSSEDNDEWLMSLADYDYYAGSHIFNQLERLKSNHAVRNQCFDIIQDYRDLEKRLNNEVYGLLQTVNEPVTRILSHISTSTTPDAMKDAMEQLEQAQEHLQEYVAERNQLNRSALQEG